MKHFFFLLITMAYYPCPRLEIKADEMNYSGHDGCSNFFGGIIELDETTIRFGIAAGTRKICQDMTLPDQFNKTLPLVTSYKIEDRIISLFDDEGVELMQRIKE